MVITIFEGSYAALVAACDKCDAVDSLLDDDVAAFRRAVVELARRDVRPDTAVRIDRDFDLWLGASFSLGIQDMTSRIPL